MPKSRSFTPHAAESKRWYTHSQGDERRELKSRTSTREMQEAPFDPKNISRAASSMPRVFYTRMNHQIPVFKHQNAFTDHDNRNVFQGHGVYFGASRDERTLGKRLRTWRDESSSAGAEWTSRDQDYLRHEDGTRYGYDYRTTYTTAYSPMCEPTMPAVFRRFPRCHTNPELLRAEPPTCTTYNAPLPPQSISTETLGQAQIPYPGHNGWRYSNNKINRVYPDLPALRATAGLTGGI